MTLIALALSALVSPAAAQSYRDTGSAFCICPSGKRGNVGRPQDDYKTCEEFCGMTGGGGPGVDYGAIQRAEQERVERERRQAEAQKEADRKAKRAMEQRQFEADKADAVSKLKGVSSGGVQLKGVSAAPNGLKGLKGLDPAGPVLKGVDETAHGKECRPDPACYAALDTQEAALEGARKDQGDLYMAMGTADLKHGLGLAHDEANEKVEEFKQSVLDNANPFKKKDLTDGPLQYYEWTGKDSAGIDLYQRDYKTTVDGIANHITKQRATALNGGYDARKKSVLKSEEARETIMEQKRKLDDLLALAKNLKTFRRYLEELQACARGEDADFDKCVGRVTQAYELALKSAGVKLSPATEARVKAAAEAYTKYSHKALDRAKEAATAASRCSADCR